MLKKCYLILFLIMGNVLNSTSQTITNYSFAASGGSFTALSGATTASGTGTVDEGYWNGIPTGFDFWYMGNRYTSVSASTNGWLTLGANITNATNTNSLSGGGAPRPILAPLWDDLNIQNTTNASYLTNGAVGSRVFTLQFLNYKWDRSASGNTISFQVKLYEATGKIEYVYRQESGSVNAGTASIGIATTATGSGNFLSLNGTGTAPSASAVTETAALNTKPATGQTYAFTPPVPVAPSGLAFTGVTSTATSLNWSDNSSNESGFVIYRSTDNVSFTFATQVAANSTAAAQTGLAENTLYYWKVYAVTEGALSNALSGSQSTASCVPAISGTAAPTCVGGSTGTITAAGTGGTAPYTYNLNGGAYQAGTTFSGLAAGTYTLGIRSNTGCVASTSITVIAYTTAADDQNAAATNSWIGHIYDGTNFSNYTGQFTEAETFNEAFGGNAVCFNVVSNAVTRSIYTESFSVKYKMNSTKRGLYAVDLGSDDGSRLTVDGTMVYNNWSDQSFATKPSVLISLGGTSSLLYEFYESSGGNQVVFQNLTLVLSNTISANTTQSFCTGSTGAAISGDTYGTLPAGITLSGTGYQWTYSTTAGGVRTNIAGATGAAFTPSGNNAPFNTPGTYYVYRNAVLSSTNNVSPNPYVAANESNAAMITVTGNVISQIPASSLLANYKFNGDAYDAAGNNTGTLQNAPAQTADRFNNANKAYTFNGTSQYVSTANAYTNPVNFTISLWFKTNTVTGGKLIGFGATQVGTSGQYDRHIYMNNAGQIYFGVYPGTVVTVNSALSYNDNNWHLATATLSSTAGMVLYVDGVQVGSNPATLSAENYTGYWKIGYDNMNGWTSQPTSHYFNGSIDDVLIYGRALSASEVGVLYTSPDGAGNTGPVCTGSAIGLTATTVSGATYAWTGPNSFTSASQNPSFTYTALTAGTYTLAVTLAGCTTTAYTNVKTSANTGQWTGNTSTDWADATNWCTGIVPTSATNVTITSTATRMPAITSSISCNSLTINAGATLTISSAGTLNIAGVLTNNGTLTNSGTVNFNGTSGQQTFSGVSSFYNLTISNATGLLLPNAITVNNNLLISAGVLNANNFNVAVKGNWTNNASTSGLSAGTATVTFSGTAAQTIGGSFATAFNNLTVAATASAVSLGSNVVINGNLTVSSGTFDLLNFTANRSTMGGTLTVSNNATLKIGGTNTYPSNYATNTLVVASTVEYAGTNQTVANQTYGNLTLSSAAGSVTKTFPATALSVVGNLTSTLGAGTAVLFTAASNITVNGNTTIGASTTFDGGSFSNSIGGNWTNNGTFNGNTGTIVFTGPGAVVGGSGSQLFNNLIVAASLVSFSNSSIALTGNLATISSGSFTQASGGTVTMSGSSKTISGSGISLDNLVVSGTVSTAVSLTLSGNLTVSGSFTAASNTITMSGTSKTISGAGTKSFSSLSVTGSVTSDAGFSVSSALTVAGSLSASAGTATFTGSASLSGTANLFNTTINGTSLQLSANAVLGVAGAMTITAGVLNVTSSTPNTVNFNSSGAQNINAITYHNLTVSNGNSKTAIAGLTVNGNITIGTGTTFVPGNFTHSIYNNWINNGSFTAGTSTVQFLGNQNSTIIGATTFNILTVNNSSAATGVILQSNAGAATVNMTQGTMLTGSNTITITSTRTGNGIILGNITRNHPFAAGTDYAFEGPDNTINFTLPVAINSVTVSVTKGAISDFPNGSSISRVYDISIPSGTYALATLRLHYEDDELNGNAESTMALWRYDGTAWGVVGKTANSTTSNYVEQSALTDITKRWTCAFTQSVVQWNGSVSTDWNTAANWTVTGGAGSAPPAATDIVNLGTAAFNHHPAISTAVTVKNIHFGSVQPLTLSMAGGGSLVSGDINGVWSANATHTINVNNQAVSVNGALLLSDGTAGHAINLNIGTGTLNIAGSLTQSGGANIIFSGAGNLNIANDYNYTNGTFTPATGTVTYNGVVNQVIGPVGYYHLTINNAAAALAINNTTAIGGNLTVTAGELDNNATTTISGNVNIAAAATLDNHSVLHVGGNWDNSGSYTSDGTGTNVIFDGSGTQTISATTFNDLEINKPVGSVAMLTGDVTLKGNLAGTSGTLDIGSHFFNRDVTGGAATMSGSATLIIAADNAPTKFANYYMAPGSTVIFNGTGTQHLLLPGLVYGNLIFRNSGTKILYTATTVNGDLTIESGATFDAGANTITLDGNWANSGTFIPATSTILLTGATKNISGNNTFNRVSVYGSYTFLGDNTINTLLIINPGGSLSGGNTITTIMNGDLINKGILYTLGTTTFTGNVQQTMSLINAVQTVAITVNFNGSVSPILNSTSAPQYGYLNINNTGGVNPSVGWTVAYGLTVGSGASFNCGNSTHNMLGSVTNNGTITSSGTINFIPASAATINLGTDFSSTGTVVFGGAGAITLAGSPTALHSVIVSNTNVAGITPSSAWSMANDFTVNSGAVLHAGNYIHSVGGNILNNGTINSGTSTFVLDGASHQDIYNQSAFNNLTINKAGGTTTLFSDVTVNGVLNFVAGNIETGNYLLIQPSTGTVTGAAQNTGWVNGRLQKNIATGATTKSFEIGDALAYTPVSLAFSSVSSAGNLTVSATGTDHPDISSSTISASASVNRYYTLTGSGIVFSDYTATFNFKVSDVDGGANTAEFSVQNYNGSSWSVPVTASPGATSIQATGVAAFGDFAIGRICNRGTTIAYTASPYCTSAGSAAVTMTGSGGGSFSSSAGLSVNATTGAIDLGASTPGVYSVTYTIAASGDCGQFITSTSVTIGTENTWAGTISSDWNNSANWSCGGVPAGTADVTIPSGLANYPVISGTIAIHDITIQSGASVTLTGGTLQTGGAISNAGTFDVAAGTIEMNGSSAQTIPANAFSGNSILNLIINNNVTLAGELGITGAVSFGSSNNTFTTSDLLTLKSTAAGTARLADITNAGTVSGNTVSGNVTIERYIPARRSWRLLSAPITPAGAPTINAAWQEGVTSGNPTPGYGLNVTGGAIADGFEQGVNGNSTIKFYNTATGAFANLPAVPGTYVPITTYPGYFVFVRGSRSTNLMQGVNAALSPTTLRMTGALNTGNIPVSIGALNFTLVGNPYPAAIDFHTLTKSNVNDKLYVWDPKMAGTNGVGGYVTLLWNSGSNSYDATSSVSPVSRYIQSGEAFFVESMDGINPGILTIKETDKKTGGSDFVFRPIYGNEQVRANLFLVDAGGGTSLADGVLTTYSMSNSNTVDRNDALKIYNTNENLCIGRDGKNLAIERRLTIENDDTTFLNMYTLKKQDYKLEITIDAMDQSGLYAVLKDSYASSINNTVLNMAGATSVVFNVNTDPASYAVNRFSIVFAKQIVLSSADIALKAYRRQHDIAVEWTTANDAAIKEYEVQTSATGSNFKTAGIVSAKAASATDRLYKWLDADAAAGMHYYRLKSKDNDGKEKYSAVVKVLIDKPAAGKSILVYGNAIEDNNVVLQFNNLEKDNYKMQLFTMDGQLLKTLLIRHDGGSAAHHFSIDGYLPAGKYQILLSGKSAKYTTPVIKK